MAHLPILNLALRSIGNRRATAILTVLTVAISVMLFLGVEKVRHGARESFENTISGVDLIVGARSSPVNLLLYSVFHIGDATNNITWESYETVASAPGVAWTVPISLGDSHRGHRVIGSTPGLFEHYEYGGGRHLEFASGAPFEELSTATFIVRGRSREFCHHGRPGGHPTRQPSFRAIFGKPVHRKAHWIFYIDRAKAPAAD